VKLNQKRGKNFRGCFNYKANFFKDAKTEWESAWTIFPKYN